MGSLETNIAVQYDRPKAGGSGPRVASPRDRLGYQPALDGVRAISILGVIVGHMFFTLRSGGLGVDVFFVLSGFLITTLLLQEHRATGRISLRAFWWRRAARLLPALLVMCPIVLAAIVVTRPHDWRASLLGIGAALLYASSWIRAFGLSDLAWMGHTWSLSVEEWFYLAWPLFVIVALRRGSRWLRWIAVAAAVAVAYRLVCENLLPHDYLYNAPDQRACQLLVGCAAGAWLVADGERARMRPRILVWIGVAGALVVAASMSGLVNATTTYGFAFRRSESTILAVAVAAVLVAVVTVPTSLLPRVLAWKPLVAVGRRSYSLYLWHFPIFGLVLPPGAASFVRLSAARLLSLVLTAGAAALSYRYVERPVIAWVRARKAARRPTLTASTPVAEQS